MIRQSVGGLMMVTEALPFSSILACALTFSTAANATLYSYDGNIDTFTVTTTGVYDITAIGAAGGRNLYDNNTLGLPAEAEGLFSLTQGTVLSILVGQQGGTGQQSGGGGGGSFVADGITPLAVAGGGGGDGLEQFSPGGNNALTTASGGSGYFVGAGGTGGSGGDAGEYAGGAGGGGFYGSGTAGTQATGGSSYLSGGGGGVSGNTFAAGNGGFGGGGAASFQQGGGGGGYSGGGGGSQGQYGGGGGSYLDASAFDPLLTAGAPYEEGSVTITLESPVPEPTTTALLIVGLLGLAAVRYRWGLRRS